jgi:uncharacterized protein with HEPN domain
MHSELHNHAYIWDMLDAAKTTLQFTEGVSLQQYLTDRKLQLAVERLIEIIGEAARNVSTTFKDLHPDIPWQKIIAQRHVLAHDYGDIQQEKMFLLIRQNIPELISKLQPLTILPLAKREP